MAATLPQPPTIATLSPQEIVFIALKAHPLPAAGRGHRQARQAPTIVQWRCSSNIPWWLNHGPGHTAGSKGTLSLLNPGAALCNHIRPERVIGSAAYSLNEIAASGVIQHVTQNRCMFGKPDGSASARLKQVADLVGGAGIETFTMADVRSEIFRKLAHNAANNTLCSLTQLACA